MLGIISRGHYPVLQGYHKGRYFLLGFWSSIIIQFKRLEAFYRSNPAESFVYDLPTSEDFWAALLWSHLPATTDHLYKLVLT